MHWPAYYSSVLLLNHYGNHTIHPYVNWIWDNHRHYACAKVAHFCLDLIGIYFRIAIIFIPIFKFREEFAFSSMCNGVKFMTKFRGSQYRPGFLHELPCLHTYWTGCAVSKWTWTHKLLIWYARNGWITWIVHVQVYLHIHVHVHVVVNGWTLYVHVHVHTCVYLYIVSMVDWYMYTCI